MASTTSKTKAPARRETPVFEKLTEPDADGHFNAKIFGQEYTLSDDVNAWLLIRAGGGDLASLGKLVEKTIVVEPEDGENHAQAHARIIGGFHRLLENQEHLTIEKVMELVAAMTEAAGNDLEE